MTSFTKSTQFTYSGVGRLSVIFNRWDTGVSRSGSIESTRPIRFEYSKIWTGRKVARTQTLQQCWDRGRHVGTVIEMWRGRYIRPLTEDELRKIWVDLLD